MRPRFWLSLVLGLACSLSGGIEASLERDHLTKRFTQLGTSSAVVSIWVLSRASRNARAPFHTSSMLRVSSVDPVQSCRVLGELLTCVHMCA